MKKMSRAIGWMFVLGAAIAARAETPLGTAFTYQGQLKSNGIPAGGTFDLTFRLWDAVSGGVAASNSVAKLNVPVESGLFSVELDFGNSGFTGSARWLEVGVRPGGSPPLTHYTALTPRQPLNVAPYAIFALSGAGGAGFTIPFAGTQPSGSQTTFNLTQAGTGGTARFENSNAANTSNVVEIVSNGTGGHRTLQVDQNGSGQCARFTQNNPATGFAAVLITTNGTSNAVSSTTTGTGRAGYFSASNATSTSNAVEIRHDSGNSNSRGLYVLHSGYGDVALFEGTDSATGGDAVKARVNGAGQAIDALTTGFSDCGLFVVDHPGGVGDAVKATNNGNGDSVQAVATALGRAGYFQVDNIFNQKNAVEIETNGNSSSRGLSVLHTGMGDNGYFEISNASSGGEAVEARTNGSGQAVSGTNTGTGRAGFFQVSNPSNPARALEVVTNGNSSGRGISMTHTGTGDGAYFEITNAASGAEAVEARHSGSGDAVQAVHTGTGRAGNFQINNGASTNTALYCTTNGTGLAFHANGTARVNVLEILGGSDMSEGFDVAGEQIEPGMVVTIDPKNPGRLRIAAQAYDTKVAGIIAGAGGVKPGMIMKQEGSAADGKHPVALSGRVYCMTDATQTAIEPGDLLVSSDTPGHAMKSTDRERAQGAIIGKAMTALPRGEKGLVLVLVSLQ